MVVCVGGEGCVCSRIPIGGMGEMNFKIIRVETSSSM